VAATNPTAAFTYTLDSAGMRTNLAEKLNGSSSNLAWNYDGASRLITETRTGTNAQTNSYSYDNNGNRQTWTSSTGGTISYAYNTNDQIITTTAGSTVTNYQYDGRGNLKQSGTSSYTYNAADQLITAVVNGNTANYLYDQDGRRVKQVAGGNTTNYAWDETSAYGDVLLETNGSGAAQTSYVLGGSELLSQNKIGGTGISYLLHDGQGSTRALVDGSGNLRSSELYTYDAFGNLISGQSNPATNYLYTGQRFDALTTLYSLRTRYYNPTDGRFGSRDTNDIDLNNPTELNPYVYTSNNSINRIDPNGRELEEYGELNQQSEKEKAATAKVGAVTDDEFLIEQGRFLQQEAKGSLERAANSVNLSPNQITYGEGEYFDENGILQRFGSSNGFYGESGADNATVINKLKEIKSFDNNSFIGGTLEEGATQQTATHAERNAVTFVKKLVTNGKIKPDSTVLFPIVNNTMCATCFQLGRLISPGVLEITQDLGSIRILIIFGGV